MRRPCKVCRRIVVDGRCPKHSVRQKPREYGPGWESLRRSILGPTGRTTCLYCEGTATTVDHVIPRSRVLAEGAKFGLTDPNNLDNLLPCCARCNSSKKDMTLAEWCKLGLAPEPAYEVERYRRERGLPT